MSTSTEARQSTHAPSPQHGGTLTKAGLGALGAVLSTLTLFAGVFGSGDGISAPTGRLSSCAAHASAGDCRR